jgi:hypothetical protein
MASAILALGFTWPVIVRYQTQIRNGFDRRPELCRVVTKICLEIAVLVLACCLFAPRADDFSTNSRDLGTAELIARGEIGRTARGAESQLFIAGKIHGWDRRARVCYRNHKAPKSGQVGTHGLPSGHWEPGTSYTA